MGSQKVAVPQTVIRGTQRASLQHTAVLLFIQFTDVDILVKVTDKHTNKVDY